MDHNHSVLIKGPKNQYTDFLAAVARLKEIDHKFDTSTALVGLQERSLHLSGFWPSLLYLCERHPVPDLYPADVVRRAMVNSLVENILASGAPSEFSSVRPAGRFLTSDQPTLLDIAVYVTANPGHPQWGFLHQRFDEMFEQQTEAA
jgi:glutathione S-transferase